MRRIASIPQIAFFLFVLCQPAAAETQSLSLRAGWNLISLSVQPTHTDPAAVFADAVRSGALESIWAYDSQSGEWSGFPAMVGVAPLSAVRPGVGYWVKLKVSMSVGIVADDAQLPEAPSHLIAGWTLVGFPTSAPIEYERISRGLPVRQIWTYDAAARRFRGVILSPDGGESSNPLREDFTTLEAGKGYWILSGDAASLLPELATALPPDIDLPPLIPAAPGAARLPFASDLRSPGDRDIAGDDFYDRPETQRAVDFGDFTSLQKLSIFNKGAGLLSWRATVLDQDASPWLRFRIKGEIPSEDQFLSSLSGAVATETAELEMIADRTGLAPRDYHARIRIDSNAADLPPPSEASRVVDVFMTVPPLDGDYRLTAIISRINGQAADTHNPRLFLSVYRDATGLKGIIDGRRTLLIPEYCSGGQTGANFTSCASDGDCASGQRCEHNVRLDGRMYESGTARFTLTGSFELPPGAEDNPYQAPLRREITLLGDRPGRGDTLGPQDLKGEYREVIRNILAQPVYLEGTFVAQRVSPAATARDEVTSGNTTAQDVPDGATVLESRIEIEERLLLSEVDVRVNVVHRRPADLRITITSPANREVVLRDHTDSLAGDLTYDETATPKESLDVLAGTLSPGIWVLRVSDDIPGELGALINWDLQLRGTRVNHISGVVSHVGAGAKVLLSGCGVVREVTTGAGGAYEIKDLVDCLYTISVHKSGFTRAALSVSLQGVDVTGADLAPAAAAADQPIEVRLPATPSGDVLFTALTTAGGAGAFEPVPELRYAMDSANFDLDRPPRDPSRPGPEDSNLFLGVRNPLTGSNQPGVNSEINGPAEPSSARRIRLALGLPVVGTSVSGDTRIFIGAHP